MLRVQGEHARQYDQRRIAGRSQALATARLLPLASLRTLALRICFAAADAARPTLLSALLGFKLLEWWFGTAEAQLQLQGRLPAPPPPPSLPPAPEGVPLPKDRRLCPLCLRPRVNPAVAAPSGFAFCLSCLRTATDATGRCPVTSVPVMPDQVRRIYR